MTIRKLLGIVFRTLVIPVALITAIVGILKYVDVSVPMERVRQAFVNSASDTLGREVRIDGEVRLAISFFPTLVVDGLRVPNHPGWSTPDMLNIGEARAQVALMPLIAGRVELLEIAAERITLNLEQDKNGDKNWGRQSREAVDLEPASRPDNQAVSDSSPGDNFTIDEFSLTDVTINYHDAKLDNGFSDRIERLQVNTEDHSRLVASLTGDTEGIDYTFTATSNLLRNLANNQPWHFESTGQVGQNPVSLVANIDTSSGAITGDVELETSAIDIGRLLEWLRITKGLDLAAGQMRISASLRGSSLYDIVHQSTFRVDLHDGRWLLKSHVDDRTQTISFEHAAVEAVESQDLKILFAGKVGAEPLDLVFRSNPLGAFFTGVENVTLAVDAKLANADLKLNGDVKLPVSTKTFSVNMAVSGTQLNQWNQLLASDLPPLGPYSLSGHMDMTPKGFHITELDARIGDSDLGGVIKIDITHPRPLWTMNLVSNNFQIDDFDLEDYSVIPDQEAVTDNEQPQTTTRERVREVMMQANTSLEQPHDVDNLDADIMLDARQVYSGEDRLGNGQLVMALREDVMDIKQLKLNVPGGDLEGSMGIQLIDDGIEGYFRLDVEKLDYGILTRRINPDTSADGLITARVDLELSGSDFSHSLEHASGKIDFAMWPRNIGADVMNIWAVNLFFAILPSFSDRESKVNCVVAVLNTEDGQLNEQFLALDSTKVWVNGNLDVNFPKETVRLSLFPRSKTARMFGLQTPIHVRGNFDDLSLRIRPLDLIGSYASFILSPLHAPMRRIFGEQIPEDGSEICGELLDRDYLKRLQEKAEERERALDNAYSGD